MSERGKIRNLSHISQPLDFSGVKVDNATPTDIDGFLEISNRLFIFFEFKFGGSPLPMGQRVALERLADSIQAGGKLAVVLVARHDTPAPLPVQTGESVVVEYYHDGLWYIPDTRLALGDAVKSVARRFSNRR